MFTQLWQRLVGARPAPPEASQSSALPVPAAAATEEPQLPIAPGDDLALATEQSLRRSLEWRCELLMKHASPGAQAGDGPRLVESLREARDSVIRQPPDAAARALRVVSNPNSPLHAVVALFEADPMLAQALLRQANSVFYRRGDSTVSSLSAAVQHVGSKAVQSVLMGSLVQTTLCRPGGVYDALVSKVWTHMQRTAPIARAIARAFEVDPETAFSHALLHDVGKLVIFDHISTLRHRERREPRIQDALFWQMLRHLHEPLGGLAALRWGMGGEAAHAISEHHRGVPPARPDRMTECLYVSERIELAHANFTALDWERLWQEGAITADRAAVEERFAAFEH